MDTGPLRKGSQVVGGTIIGRRSARPIRGRPAPATSRSGPPAAARPTIDPKPILDGWKLLEATAIYRAAGKNPFFDHARPASARSC